MGKSCWVSLLENYYDRMGAGGFEVVFGGTDIGRNPTGNRHRYVVLRFDFSAFDDNLETLPERFEEYCRLVVRKALERNADLFPGREIQRILSPPSINAKLQELFLYAGDHGIPLYVLINEYDHFAKFAGGRLAAQRQLRPAPPRHRRGAGGHPHPDQLPLDRLDQPENFLSLLFYLGLLSIRGGEYGLPRLGIPNQTVKRLMYGYLRDAYDDVGPQNPKTRLKRESPSSRR